MLRQMKQRGMAKMKRNQTKKNADGETRKKENAWKV